MSSCSPSGSASRWWAGRIPMQSATAENLTILNFGMGSAMAATVMDLLAAIEPKAVLFLGKCGGLKKTKVGDFILPIAAIRGEGTSNDYMPPEIPALPSFRLQKAVSAMIVKHGLDYWTGTVYTTNRRVWEHDEKFKEYLKTIRASAIDMETATIFIVGFVNHIPKGALLAGLGQPDDARGGQDQPQRQVGHRTIRAEAPGDRHRFPDRAPRLRRVGQAPAVRVARRRQGINRRGPSPPRIPMSDRSRSRLLRLQGDRHPQAG